MVMETIGNIVLVWNLIFIHNQSRYAYFPECKKAGYLTHSVAHVNTHWPFLHGEYKQKHSESLTALLGRRPSLFQDQYQKDWTCCLLYLSATHPDSPFLSSVQIPLLLCCSDISLESVPWPLFHVWLVCLSPMFLRTPSLLMVAITLL